jgi:hypothetical protein
VPTSAAKPAKCSASGSLTGSYSNDISWVQGYGTVPRSRGNFLENEFVQEADDVDSQCPAEASSGRPL